VSCWVNHIEGKSKALLHAKKRMQTTYRETPRGQESTQPQITSRNTRRTQENPEKGREAAAPSFIKEIQEVQGGSEELRGYRRKHQLIVLSPLPLYIHMTPL
jgi:hypothetical protein